MALNSSGLARYRTAVYVVLDVGRHCQVLSGVEEGGQMSTWDLAPKNSKLVFEHLKLLARQMRVESYGEIAAAIGEAEGREIAPWKLSSY